MADESGPGKLREKLQGSHTDHVRKLKELQARRAAAHKAELAAWTAACNDPVALRLLFLLLREAGADSLAPDDPQARAIYNQGLMWLARIAKIDRKAWLRLVLSLSAGSPDDVDPAVPYIGDDDLFAGCKEGT